MLILKTELIFYVSHQTAGVETVLKKFADDCKITIDPVTVAVDKKRLGVALAEAVRYSKLIFIVGGLDLANSEDTNTVLLELFGGSDGQMNWFQRKLAMTDEVSGKQGFFITKGQQTIILLPDDPEAARNLLYHDAVFLLKARGQLKKNVLRESEKKNRVKLDGMKQIEEECKKLNWEKQEVLNESEEEKDTSYEKRTRLFALFCPIIYISLLLILYFYWNFF